MVLGVGDLEAVEEEPRGVHARAAASRTRSPSGSPRPAGQQLPLELLVGGADDRLARGHPDHPERGPSVFEVLREWPPSRGALRRLLRRGSPGRRPLLRRLLDDGRSSPGGAPAEATGGRARRGGARALRARGGRGGGIPRRLLGGFPGRLVRRAGARDRRSPRARTRRARRRAVGMRRVSGAPGRVPLPPMVARMGPASGPSSGWSPGGGWHGPGGPPGPGRASGGADGRRGPASRPPPGGGRRPPAPEGRRTPVGSRVASGAGRRSCSGRARPPPRAPIPWRGNGENPPAASVGDCTR